MTNPEAVQHGIPAGGGHTLGSDEFGSTCVPVPNTEQMPEPADEIAAIRHITFWRDGFNIGDGELMRYDDPANAQILSRMRGPAEPPSAAGTNSSRLFLLLPVKPVVVGMTNVGLVCLVGSPLRRPVLYLLV
ncbi:hypothetical protein JAAARDRAFT_257133 [Jaapia argillacea MUCL 33604]|uniref:SEP domain-containing protein n=1 Tax=Jaapia argillacea MUCL 33604 TaxID=933084 RepID=A0A067PW63_9AGAM|nr:hypothetical protein JAAARDRAFT_257133 [Jaapia argillacea MUCL 33604]